MSSDDIISRADSHRKYFKRQYSAFVDQKWSLASLSDHCGRPLLLRVQALFKYVSRTQRPATVKWVGIIEFVKQVEMSMFSEYVETVVAVAQLAEISGE